jgi:hypothetical protein
MAMLVATPLILLDMGLLLVAIYLLFTVFYLAVPAFPSLWLLTLVAVVSATLYLAGLVFIVMDALEDGVRQFRNPDRILRCSLLGFGMNSAGAVLGFVLLLLTLLVVGGIF